MGEHARYVDQDGVNVVHIHVDIADPQESADIENNLYQQLYVSPPLSPPSVSTFPPQNPPTLFHNPCAMCMEEGTLNRNSQDAAQKNQVRFYRTSQRLSDGGGGITVYYNGKKIEHKKVVMGSLNALVEAIAAALEKYNSH